MHDTAPFISKISLRSKEALVRGLIWAFVGTLYGMLFLILAELATFWEWPINAYFFAGILAGTTGAVVYSSMRLAVVMAIYITPVCVLYFVFADNPVILSRLLLLFGVAGAVIGALYGAFSSASRIHRADAKALCGFSAGFLTSLTYLMLSSLFVHVPLGLVVGLMCPLTGILYVSFVPTFIRLYDSLLPTIGDGIMVGTTVAMFLAICFFVMISSISTETAGELLPSVQRMHQLLPQTIGGGLIGGGITGVLSGLLVDNWQDL